ncbi:type I restriction enzyme HsdR N-terminal domain-containing protein [Odoribacter laneus]|uniref:type I restriction enzyme HsdR N-terminal domain-containing protein n=1 Tax=Odoribacter laneus TaxID=626933 RepID=UPI00033EF04A|nr:type I restriction enzyme HsdR N-terminal domain-containing protein [Odoribacter laneus]MBS1446982.1 type I restriction enzyme HsdR N-terminal domain-containing protein [Odoribacter sp.]CCZ80559.1 putative uncharacterized protein [Odoribacter laneus CAG:561]
MHLSLPAFEYKVKKQEKGLYIYDIIRKKYVLLTPEEWVRQHFIHYLIHYKNYAPALVAIEREIDVYGLKKRFDIVCYDRQGKPYLIVECKAASVPLSQQVFDQVFGYNLTLAARYVVVTNGRVHLCGYTNEERIFCFLEDIPDFK